MNVDADVIFYGGAAGCVDRDTEFLTSTGWKVIGDYSQGDLVGAYNPETEEVSLEAPEEYIKLPCDTLTHIKARGIDQQLSPEHRVVYWHNRGYGHKVLPFSEVQRRHLASRTKGWTGRFKTSFKVTTQGLDISEGSLRLQVAVMADGRVVKEGANNYTQMRFSKERKYIRLLALCKKHNLKYKDNGCKRNTKYSNNKEYEVIVWPEFPDKSFDEKYWKCSQEQLEIISDEVKHWDSSISQNASSQTIRYSSKNEHDVEFIQYVFHTVGLNTSVYEDKRKEKYTNSHFYVTGSPTGDGFRCLANKDKKAEFKEVSTVDGFKYCFTVSTGMLVTRRCGSIVITGNSGKSRLLLMRPLRYINDPNFEGIFFRKNTTQLTGAGGLWPESKKIYSHFKPRVREKDLQQIFKSGATLNFKYLDHENDAQSHMGLQYSFIGFDELTTYSSTQFTYLLSRLRSAADMNSFCLGTCNPDPDSWVIDWIKWYLDELGFPREDRCGVVRYF